jgi:hypothetical protein
LDTLTLTFTLDSISLVSSPKAAASSSSSLCTADFAAFFVRGVFVLVTLLAAPLAVPA